MASLIVKNLYLGSLQDAQNLKWLHEKQITHIINVSDADNIFPDRFKYVRIAMKDDPSYDISHHFGSITDYIGETLKKGGKVLVHCNGGVSRSPTLVIAYLISTLNKTPKEAYTYVQTIRHKVFPNIGFVKQLNKYFSKRGEGDPIENRELGCNWLDHLKNSALA